MGVREIVVPHFMVAAIKCTEIMTDCGQFSDCLASIVTPIFPPIRMIRMTQEWNNPIIFGQSKCK